MISFYLTNRSRKTSPIVMTIYFRSTKYNIYIGQSVRTSSWSLKKQRLKVSSDEDIDSSMINMDIELWSTAAKKALFYFNDKNITPTSDEMKRVVTSFRYEKNPTGERIKLTDYFNKYLQRHNSDKTKGRLDSIEDSQNLLLAYEEYSGDNLYLDNLDVNFYTDLKDWFFNVRKCSTNYFFSFVANIKQICSEAKEADKLNVDSFVLSRNFHAHQDFVDNIYLTEDELMQIYKLDITADLVLKHYEGNKTMKSAERYADMCKKVRDMFILSAFTGLRYSDIIRLNKDNFANHITIVSKKTKTTSVIPIHWVVKEIIDRGYDFSTSKTSSTTNRLIKFVAKMAGITQTVVLNRSVNGKMMPVTMKKYEAVCCHTARRSFATNAYKSGIQSISIMKLTGHKSESSFMRYIKIGNEENAELLKNHTFFKND